MTNRYWPRQFQEMASDPTPVSWINEPVPPENVTTLVRPTPRSLPVQAHTKRTSCFFADLSSLGFGH